MSHSEPPAPEGVRAQAGPAVTWRKVARVGAGIVLTPLGLLWVLQGADLVRIQPVLCVAECQPVTGGSPVWLTIGVVSLLGGLVLLGGLRALKALRKRR